MKTRVWAIPVALAAAYLAAGAVPSGRTDGFDLRAFGKLPVLSNGRIKPMDTVARTSLLMIRGKQTIRHEGRSLPAIAWLLDAMARPELANTYKAFQINDPDVLGLIGIEQKKERYFSYAELAPHLGVIEEQARRAEAVEAQVRDRFQAAIVNLYQRLMLYHRLKNSLRPSDARQFGEELEDYRSAVAPGIAALRLNRADRKHDARALSKLNSFFERYKYLSEIAYFRALPPAEGERPDDWMSVGDGLMRLMRAEPLHPAAQNYWDILDAYERRDAAGFNAAVARQTAALRSSAPQAAGRGAYESFFNRFEPFYRGSVLYVAALLLSFAAWLGWRQGLQRAAFMIVAMSFLVHTFGLLSRMYLEGRPPVTNLYSSAVFVGWAAVLLGLILERIYRQGFGTIVAAVTGFATLLVAHHLTGSGDTMEMMRAVLDSNFWLGTHVVTITIGYSGTFLAGALAHAYLIRRLVLPPGDADKTLVSMTYGVVCFSLFFSFVGTVLGGIWADQSWGRFWGWDPKENGALLIVLWNALALHARWGGLVREKGFIVLTVFGDIVTSWSWFGVNMLGIGLHSYGFMDKAFVWLAAFMASQLCVMTLGLLPEGAWSRIFYRPVRG